MGDELIMPEDFMLGLLAKYTKANFKATPDGWKAIEELPSTFETTLDELLTKYNNNNAMMRDYVLKFFHIKPTDSHIKIRVQTVRMDCQVTLESMLHIGFAGLGVVYNNGFKLMHYKS